MSILYCIPEQELVMTILFSEPVMRPSQKSTEERKWVLDTINKYFDVIVEEEDEDEFDEDDTEDEDNDFESASENESEDSELSSLSVEEDIDDEIGSEDQDQQGAGPSARFHSSTKMRDLLKKAATNVSSSQSNLATLEQLKLNLGTRIKQSTEQLNCQ